MLTFTKGNMLKIFKGYVITTKEKVDKMQELILKRLENDGVTGNAINELFMWGETKKTTKDEVTEGAFIDLVENAIFSNINIRKNTKAL